MAQCFEGIVGVGPGEVPEFLVGSVLRALGAASPRAASTYHLNSPDTFFNRTAILSFIAYQRALGTADICLMIQEAFSSTKFAIATFVGPSATAQPHPSHGGLVLQLRRNDRLIAQAS